MSTDIDVIKPFSVVADVDASVVVSAAAAFVELVVVSAKRIDIDCCDSRYEVPHFS